MGEDATGTRGDESAGVGSGEGAWPVWVVAALGALIAAGAASQVPTLFDGTWLGTIDAAVGFWFGVVLLWSAVRLRRTPFSAAELRQVLWWCLGGCLLVGFVTSITPILAELDAGSGAGLSIRRLAVNFGAGAIAGTVAGALYVDARRKRRRAERATEQFAFVNSVLRHDIRNKVAVVQGYADLLADEADADLDGYVEPIVSQAEDVDRIIADAGAVANAVASDADLERVDLSELLSASVAELEGAQPEARVTASIPDGLAVRADDGLSTVFRNLLTNAVEHADADRPRVAVEATRRNGAVRVAVADDGPGVPEGDRESVFERGEGGQGLGLYLVDTLVAAYDGAVWVEESEWGGARFVVELPAAE